MSKAIKLAPLADRIVSHTPPRSYRNRDHLDTVVIERNYNRLGHSGRACEILSNMVEKRLIDRDGAAYADCAESSA